MMSSAYKVANDHSDPDGSSSSNTKPSVPNTFLSSALSSISGPWNKSSVSSSNNTFTTSPSTSCSSTSSTKKGASTSSNSLNRRGQSRSGEAFTTGDSYDLWKTSDTKSSHLSKSPSGSVESAWSTGSNHFSLGANKPSLGVPVSPVLSTNSRSSDHGTSGLSPAFGATSSLDPSALFLGPPGTSSLPRRTQPIPLPSSSPASASGVGNGQGTGNLASSVTTIASSTGSTGDDELIPTAIVIKNIPFAIKKEQLLDVMTSLSLPLPFAFNYHFDNGVFRGLAFANFTSPEETATVISHLNGREIGGRKLRVEYKKMLPLAERERIEREKRERRGQLEEQHRGQSKHHGHHNHGSNHSNASSTHGSTNSAHGNGPGNGGNGGGMRSTSAAGGQLTGLDLNDPETLEFYSQLLLFRDDKNRKEFAFNSNLGAQQRRTIAMLCGQLGLFCSNNNDNVVSKHPPAFNGVNNSSSTLPIMGAGLPGHMGPAGYFEGTGAMHQPQPQYGNFLPQHTLRGTKSFADIRTPSYPYSISGSGTPNGSPYFTSQTPPPSFHGMNAPYPFHGDIQPHNTFVPGAGGNNMSYPLSYQHQQRTGGASFSPHSQLMTTHSSQPPGGNFDYMPSLSDSFSNMMSLGGSSSSVSTYQPFNTPRVASTNALINDGNKSNTTTTTTTLKNDTQSSATSDGESSSSRSPSSTLGAIGSKHNDDTKNE